MLEKICWMRCECLQYASNKKVVVVEVDERVSVLGVGGASSCTCVRAGAETDEMKIERTARMDKPGSEVGSRWEAGKRASTSARLTLRMRSDGYKVAYGFGR